MANLLWATASALIFLGALHAVRSAMARLFPAAVVLPSAIAYLNAVGVMSGLGFVVCAVGFPRSAPAEPAVNLTVNFTVSGILVGLAAIGVALNPRSIVNFPGHVFRRMKRLMREDRHTAIALSFLAFVAFAAVPWILMPPYRPDEFYYHLTIPVQYLLKGGFTTIPGNIYDAFPGFAELLFFWMLGMGSESAARGVQLFVFILGVGALVQLCRDLPKPAILAGCLLFAATPVVFCELPTTYVDIIQTVFEIAGILCLARSMEDFDPAWLYSGAWLTGCACACKYTALAQLPFAFLIVMLGMSARQRRGDALPPMGRIFAAAAISLLPVVPWLVKNYFERGNPLFPFAAGGFPSGEFTPYQQQIFKIFLRNYGPHVNGEPVHGWMALLLLPADVLFAAEFNTMRFDGIIGPLPVVAAAGWVLAKTRAGSGNGPRIPRVLAGYGAYRLLIWLSTSWQLRFLIPAFWILCLAVPGIYLRLRRGAWRHVFLILTAACAAYMIYGTAVNMPRFDQRVWGGDEARLALRHEIYPPSALCDELYRDAIRNTRSGEMPYVKVMLIWSKRLSYWCRFDQHSDSIEEATTINDWLLEGGARRARRGFQEMRITHVIAEEELWFVVRPGAFPEEIDRLRKIHDEYQVLKQTSLRPIARILGRTLYRVGTP